MNVVSVVLQLFVVSRVIKYFGVRAALFIMPLALAHRVLGAPLRAGAGARLRA